MEEVPRCEKIIGSKPHLVTFHFSNISRNSQDLIEVHLLDDDHGGQ